MGGVSWQILNGLLGCCLFAMGVVVGVGHGVFFLVDFLSPKSMACTMVIFPSILANSSHFLGLPGSLLPLGWVKLLVVVGEVFFNLLGVYSRLSWSSGDFLFLHGWGVVAWIWCGLWGGSGLGLVGVGVFGGGWWWGSSFPVCRLACSLAGIPMASFLGCRLASSWAGIPRLSFPVCRLACSWLGIPRLSILACRLAWSRAGIPGASSFLECRLGGCWVDVPGSKLSIRGLLGWVNCGTVAYLATAPIIAGVCVVVSGL